MELTFKEVKKVFPYIPRDVYNEIFKCLDKYSLNLSIDQLCMFFAICGCETGGFKRYEENLNYTSAKRLKEVFPSYFKTKHDPRDYIKDPKKLGNLVYKDKLGNTDKDDGYTYRGRGIIQLTGKRNYKLFSEFLDNPTVLETPDVICLYNELLVATAVWYWKANKLNKINDFRKVCKKVSGSLFGYERKLDCFQKLLENVTHKEKEEIQETN